MSVKLFAQKRNHLVLQMNLPGIPALKFDLQVGLGIGTLSQTFQVVFEYAPQQARQC
jgi:hypothetical protein